MAWGGIIYLAVCYVGLAYLIYVSEGNEEGWAKLKRLIAASSLTSFLSSGSAVETSVSHHPMDTEEINATGSFYAQMFDLDTGEDVAVVYAEHQAFLKRLSQATAEQIVVMRRDQLVLAVKYADRRFAATKDLLGELDAAPPDTEWPFGDEIEEVGAVRS